MVGRKAEVKILEDLKNHPKSAFVAVYGRRRVGKTYLVRTVFEGQFSFQLSGLANTKLKIQLANFNAHLLRYFPILSERKPAENWFWAFQNLIDGLESLPDGGKKVVFLDELPWFDSPQSGFVTALEHFWNNWASARKDVILVVCGSAASWIINNLINNRGGLHNRVTHRIVLEPFTLSETEQMLNLSQQGVFDRYQIVQLYMALGGIPFYLEQVDTGQSAAQNINHLCFSPNGLLRNEFNNLYASLFKKSDYHVAIVEALAQKSKGLGRRELLARSKVPEGGTATRVLRELEESSFIRKYRDFGKKMNNPLYQLCDFYSLFYLKFIRDSSPSDKNQWINSLDNPAYRAWSDYAFEQVCLWHSDQLKKALGIQGVNTVTSAWLGGNSDKKAQVDLVIDRRDHVINLFEMKFSLQKIALDKAAAEALREKVGLFKEATKTRKSVFLTVVSTFGLEWNAAAAAVVQQDFTMDVLFE